MTTFPTAAELGIPGSEKDERCGMPSASAMQRYALCPGSYELESEFGLDESTKYSELGDEAHKCFEEVINGDSYLPGKYSKQAEDAALKMHGLAVDAIVRAASDAGFGITLKGMMSPLTDPEWEGFTEKRLWRMITTVYGYSGKFDLMLINKRRRIAIIVDAKSGWGDVPEADTNLQLKAMVALVATWAQWHARAPVDTIYCAIAQVSKGKPSICKYTSADIATALSEIDTLVSDIAQKGLPRKPSKKACDFCSAKSFCPEATTIFMEVANNNLPSDWPTILEKIEVALIVAESLRKKAKEELEANPSAIPGWGLKKGAIRTNIKDPAAAFSAVMDIVPADDFIKCCTVKIGELTKKFTEKSGLGRGSRKALETRLDGHIEKVESAPSLVRVSATSEPETE